MFHSQLQGTEPRPPVELGYPIRPGDLSRLVREALEHGRIRMEFQRVVMLGASTRAALHEGLVRILDGEGRTIPAGHFMSAVEEGVLGRDLDCAALSLGLQALRQHPELRLAVNASARSLGNGTWRATLEEGVRDLGPRLTLEVREGSVALLADRMARFMAELRPSGLSFVLDDFGSGPLSLRQLRDFGFDGVKIDRSFVKGIAASRDDQELVGALVSVAQRFGMLAVAKGVENEADAAQLRALGVDGLQGYLYGRPSATP